MASGQCKKGRRVESRVVQFNADSVEWCPVPRCASLLLCGTYQLIESEENMGDSSKNEKIGKLYTFEFSTAEEEQRRDGEAADANKYSNNNDTISNDKSLKLIEEKEEMLGILDAKWSFKEICERAAYGLADAAGGVNMWMERKRSGEVESQEPIRFDKLTCVCREESVLALSLDWDNAVDGSSEPQIVASYSDGEVAVVAVAGVHASRRWKAHDFEAWTCAFNYYNKNVVYTGGDDCRLKGWDLRTDCYHSTFTSKQHQLGVCSIQQNFLYDNLLATGSYDERVLFWDQRSMEVPLKEVGVGGGVWRVKWEPQEATEVAVAAMYGGFHVIDCAALCGKKSEHESAPEVVASYLEHKSLAYGVDWCKLPPSTSALHAHKILASCSFYDCLLNIWTI